jgi:hypothetical protein
MRFRIDIHGAYIRREAPKMIRRVIASLAFASLLPACGDLASAVVSVDRPSYTTSGDVVASLPRALVKLDGRLTAETAQIPLGLPAGAEVVASSISADGSIAAISWSRGPDEGGMTTTDVIRVADQKRLLQIPRTFTGTWLSAAGDLLGVGERVEEAGTYGNSVYDVASGARLWWTTDINYGFAFAPDGTRVYGVGNIGDVLKAWDSRTGELLMMKGTPAVDGVGNPYLVISLAASSDGRRLLVSLARSGAGSPNVCRYGWFRASDLEVEQIIPQADGYDMAVATVISPDGQRFASVASHNQPVGNPFHLQVWTSSGSMLYAIESTSVGGFSFSPDGGAIVASVMFTPSDSPGLSLFRVSDGAVIGSHTFTADPL